MDMRESIMNQSTQTCIAQGNTVLGIELGSTRIKAILIDQNHKTIATGGFEWENRYENGVWTYHIEEVWAGLQACFAELSRDVLARYETPLLTVRAMGISAMMHGYLAFDAQDNLLAPFRTWRNTSTAQGAKIMSEAFQFNVPQRWSVSHFYQAMLNKEEHVSQVSFLTTLSGYVHWKLTGEKVLGVGDASGMFPIDSGEHTFDATMLQQFDVLATKEGFEKPLLHILPQVLCAGETGGCLSPEGALLLDPTGALQSGIPMCPPEGDAGTGMVATNSVATHTGNISAGTSIFAMVVLENMLSKMYEEIDMVTTPSGKPVAMVHCNNCTNEINAWVGLFQEVCSMMGMAEDKNQLFIRLFQTALKGDADCGGLLGYNYLSGEPLTGFEEGRPLFTRTTDSRFTLANFMLTQLYSACATLKLGMNIFVAEKVKIQRLLGHGGFFKTPEVGQKVMAAAMNVPIVVMETASEGGAWGIALLAAYLANKSQIQSLEDYLDNQVFAGEAGCILEPEEELVNGFNAFMHRYEAGLKIEKAATEVLLK